MTLESMDSNPAEDVLQEQRTLSDAELIKEGAKVKAGVLDPTGEQIEEIHREMRREKGEYSSNERELILRFLDGVVLEQEIHSRKTSPETRLSVNSDILLSLVELRQINPTEFDQLYTSRLDWEKIKAAFNEDKKQYSRSTFAEDIALIKELFPDKFAAEIIIEEKLWKKMIRDCRQILEPNPIAAAFLSGERGPERNFMRGMVLAANIGLLDKQRFSQEFKISEDQLRRFEELIKQEEKIRDRKDLSGRRALRLFRRELGY